MTSVRNVVAPPELMTSPASTIMRSGLRSTRGNRRRKASAAIQWVAASLPSSTPAAAARKAPVHELATRAPAACHLAIHGTQVRLSWKDGSRSSSSPGTTTRSGGSSWAAATCGCITTPSLQAIGRSSRPARRTSKIAWASGSRAMRQARSVLQSASISPAVLIDAQPVGAVIATVIIPAFAPSEWSPYPLWLWRIWPASCPTRHFLTAAPAA